MALHCSSNAESAMTLEEEEDKYKAMVQVVAKAALTAFKNHLWYLSPDMIPLALFGDGPVSTKTNIAKAILKFPQSDTYSSRFGSGFGKPIFPGINEGIKIENFVWQDSWKFFKQIKIDRTFLDKPVACWPDDPNYVQGKQNVDALKVVNDSAERGVKLANDFLVNAKREENCQNILQVVENDRNRIPNQRKYTKLESKKWYLVLH